jgi:hypothetical protein
MHSHINSLWIEKIQSIYNVVFKYNVKSICCYDLYHHTNLQALNVAFHQFGKDSPQSSLIFLFYSH